MSKSKTRRDSTDFLIKAYRSQTALAAELGSSTLSQPILSAIQRGKRPLHQHEAREIERRLGIPFDWMDQPGWVKAGWSICKRYRALAPEDQELLVEAVKFALGRQSAQ
jgi:hypothetical protein